MKFFGHIDLNGNQIINASLQAQDEFPAGAKAGDLCFRRKRVYICADIESGMPVWVPMTQEIDTYVHTQQSAATTWTINHGLNTAVANITIYDENNKMIFADEVDASVFNQLVITFGTAQAGRAVVTLGDLYGAPKDVIAYTESFSNLSTWVVMHGLGYFPDVGIYIGGQMVQPQSIVNDSTTQCTITFSAPQSGSVRCI